MTLHSESSAFVDVWKVQRPRKPGHITSSALHLEPIEGYSPHLDTILTARRYHSYLCPPMQHFIPPPPQHPIYSCLKATQRKICLSTSSLDAPLRSRRAAKGGCLGAAPEPKARCACDASSGSSPALCTPGLTSAPEAASPRGSPRISCGIRQLGC